MSAQAFKEKGNNFLQAKQFDDAIQAYTEAINLDPKDHVFFSNRSAAYLSKGDASSALSDAQRCIELKGDWSKGYSRKGAALHSLRRYDEAVNAYEDGIKISPDDAALKSGLEEVKKIKQSSYNAPPPNGGGLFGPQMIAKLAGHPKFGPKLGDPAFRMKLQMAQSNPQLMMSDPEMMEVLQALIGGMSSDLEEDEHTSRPIPTNTSSAPASRKEPEPEYYDPEQRQAAQIRDGSNKAKDKGNDFYKARQFADALTAYDEALRLDPTNVMVMNNKAAVYIEMNECDTAVEVCNLIFDKAKSVGQHLAYTDRSKVYQRIAAAHQKKNDLPASIKAYGKALMEVQDKAVERKMKNLELEHKKLEKQQYVNPELGLLAKEKGNTAFREGNFPAAIAEYEDAVKRDPTNAPYHNNLAAAYLKMGVFNDAKKSVEKALELDKTYVKAWAKKGDIEFFMKEYHKSMDSYKAGLVLEPDNSLCKQGLQKTMMKVQEENMTGTHDKERSAHAMADPEIQAILSDPTIRQVLTDFQENPKFAQQAVQNDKDIRTKIEKLIAAGVLQVK